MIYPLRLTDGALMIDNSSLSLVAECFRKSAYGLSLRKKQSRDETALRFGGSMHSILEARYAYGTDVEPNTEPRMIAAAQASFMEWEPPLDDFRNLDQAIACLQAYNKAYPKESFKILEVNGHAGTETPFAVPIAEIKVGTNVYIMDTDDEEPKVRYLSYLPVIFTGRIDLVIEQMNTIWLMDHKTSSIGGQFAFAPFYTDSQFKGYAWAVKQLLDLPRYPAGVKINLLINRKPTRTGKSIEFLRDDINFSECVIDEWKDNFISLVGAYLNCIIDQKFPMSTPACISKFGKCEFYDVCSLPVAQRALMLNSGNYTDRTWDPILQDNDKQRQVYVP